MSRTTGGIDRLLLDARRGLDRLEPKDALAAQQTGAVLVDIRPQINRDTEGTIRDAIVIDRNVLEWRLDPANVARLDFASYELHVVLFCNEGFASSLAAVTLREIGVRQATDIVGGFRAWRACGLPVAPPRRTHETLWLL